MLLANCLKKLKMIKKMADKEKNTSGGYSEH